MIDVGARRSVARNCASSADPIHDLRGVAVRSDAVPDSVQIQEREAVFVAFAFLVDAAVEAGGLLVPELLVRGAFDLGRVTAQGGRIQRFIVHRNTPAGIVANGLFGIGQRDERRVVLRSRVHVVPTERHDVPVIVPNAAAVEHGLGAVGIGGKTGQSIVAGPRVADVFILETAQHGLLITYAAAHAADGAREEIDVAGPAEIVPRGHHEDRVVDGVSCVVGGEERVDGKAHLAFARRKRNAYALDAPVPQRMPVHGRLAVRRAGDLFVVRVAAG